MVGAECAPWSKTGGLGDVMGALPKALARRGHRVMVVAPRYENYDNAWETGVRRSFKVMGGDVEVRAGVLLCVLRVASVLHSSWQGERSSSRSSCLQPVPQCAGMPAFTPCACVHPMAAAPPAGWLLPRLH